MDMVTNLRRLRMVSQSLGDDGKDLQSVITIVDEPRSLLNSAEEPILTEEGILVCCDKA